MVKLDNFFILKVARLTNRNDLVRKERRQIQERGEERLFYETLLN